MANESAVLYFSRTLYMMMFTFLGASPGKICYSDAQCHLKDEASFCDFVLRNVFGVCTCLHGKTSAGDCSRTVTGKNVC